jgi:hypothetical protein
MGEYRPKSMRLAGSPSPMSTARGLLIVKFLYVRTIFPRVRSGAATLLIAPVLTGGLRIRGSVGFLRVVTELPARAKKFDEISRSPDKSEQQ